MATQGPLSPGTMADDATVGTVAWTNPDNAKVSDNVYATADLVYGQDYYKTVQLVIGGSVVGTNPVTPLTTSTPITDDNSYISYGGSTNLFGNSISPSQVNSSDFGVVFQATSHDGTTDSHYLKATNFGFTIPTGATINGVLVETAAYNIGMNGITSVDHIRITVYYTTSTPLTISGVSSMSGIVSITSQ